MESARDRHRYRRREAGERDSVAGEEEVVGRQGGEGWGAGMCHLREKHLEWRKAGLELKTGVESEGAERETKQRTGGREQETEI